MTIHSRRILVILLITFAILLAIAFIRTQPSPENSREAAAASIIDSLNRVYPNILENDISAIRLRDPNSDVSFSMARSRNGEWVTPEGQPLNENAALIARTLALLPYSRTLVPAADSNLSEYGFNPNGLIRIEMIMNDGSAHAVAIGRLSPSGDTYYAMVDNQPNIYVLIRHAVDYLITQLRNPPTA